MGPWGKIVPVWFTPLIFVHLLLEVRSEPYDRAQTDFANATVLPSPSSRRRTDR
jgi:hypothetical protein